MLWCVGQVGYPIAREWTGSISKLLVTVEAVASTPSSFWYPSGPWRTMCSFSYSLRWGVYTKKKIYNDCPVPFPHGERYEKEEKHGRRAWHQHDWQLIYYKGSMERDAGSGLWWEKKEPSIAQTDFLLVKWVDKSVLRRHPLTTSQVGNNLFDPAMHEGRLAGFDQTWRPNPPLWVLGDFRGEWKRNLPYVQCRSPRIPKLAWSLIWKHGKDAWGSTPAMEGRAFIGVCHTVAWFGQTLLLQSRCFSCPSQGFHGRHCSKCTGFSNGLAWFSRILLFIMLSVWT